MKTSVSFIILLGFAGIIGMIIISGKEPLPAENKQPRCTHPRTRDSLVPPTRGISSEELPPCTPGGGEDDPRLVKPVPKKLFATMAAFETTQARSGKVLVEQEALRVNDGDAVVYQIFTADQLSQQPLYLKRNDGSGTCRCLVGKESSLATIENVCIVNSQCTIMHVSGVTHIDVDGKTIIENLAQWDAFWISEKQHAKAPAGQCGVVAEQTVKDGFMRKKLSDDNWHITTGAWRLKQYGGGMAETKNDQASSAFERAVNPFSVTGQGILTYGEENAIHNRGEACFYFGTPWRMGAVDKNSLPKGSMYMAQGAAAGPIVGFGWNAPTKRFTVVQWLKPGDAPVILAEMDGLRPPVTNWVKIGLQVKAGWLVEGLLDGKVVLSHKLDSNLKGPFHIIGSGAVLEFDDFSISPLKQNVSKGNPVYVRSRSFAGKKEKQTSDPDEFGDWARGESAFLRRVSKSKDGRFKKAVLMSRWPLMGDFYYETVPESDVKGELPAGVYEIELLVNETDGLPVYDDMTRAFRKRLVYDDDGWQLAGEGGGGMENQTVLCIRRLNARDNSIEMTLGKSHKILKDRLDGPVYIAISRLLPKVARLKYPHPEHHTLASGTLINDFFEGAPVDWSWIDGGFRMDCRWACQDQWNFMACGSREVPMLVSKRIFSGNQEHEYFMTLRPMLPSDGDDPLFTFSKDIHREHLSRFSGWYNKHDLNFSFCMDGRNPMSGYSLVYGGKDNKETRLLRKGTVVGTRKDLLFPESSNHTAVHWLWWAFTVRKYGGRIIVQYKGKPIFDYLDPEPLDGGHVAFWSIRNGFILSKVVSTAETISWKPDVLYVNSDDKDVKWKPLIRDSVSVTKGQGGMTTVRANAGCGSMGVRYSLPPPVILKRRPVMSLPLVVPKGTKINLHLQIDDTSFVIQLSAPLAGCKALLTPEFEPDYRVAIRDKGEEYSELKRNEFFNIPIIARTTMESKRLLGVFEPGTPIKLNLMDALKKKGYEGPGRLRSITIGNTSNDDYLMVGNGANQAGATYSVGTPVFTAE